MTDTIKHTVDYLRVLRSSDATQIISICRIQNPVKTLKLELKTTGLQYFLPMAEWKNKVNIE
jgi:hypothetical protein